MAIYSAEQPPSRLNEWIERVLPNMPPKQRLASLTFKERLIGLSPEELAQLWDLLTVGLPDWLRKVEAMRVAQIQLYRRYPGMDELSERMFKWCAGTLRQIPPEQRVAGLTVEERLHGLSTKKLTQLKNLLSKYVKH